jgi:hypothetical protein
MLVWLMAAESVLALDTKASYKTGDTGPAGGILFFVDEQCMEAAPAFTEFEANWYEAIERCKSFKVNGIGGWYLPTKEELTVMYMELKKKDIGDFSGDFYWSFSEFSDSEAWFKCFIDDFPPFIHDKGSTYSVRLVRALGDIEIPYNRDTTAPFGSRDNPYDWSTTAAQKANANIEVGSYVRTASGNVRQATTDEVQWAKGLAAPAAAAGSAAKPTVTKSSYQTGDTGPAGGTVFFCNGQRMEAAPASTEFGASWDYAVKRCKLLNVKGIGGWHLPTKEELNAMYEQLHKQGLGGFSNSWYWSSSESNITKAWFQDFDDGYQYDGAKYYEDSVRAVQAF